MSPLHHAQKKSIWFVYGCIALGMAHGFEGQNARAKF
jgi:hypothetical protein